MTAGTPTIPKVNPLTVIWGEVLVAMDHLAVGAHLPLDWAALATMAAGNVANAARVFDATQPDSYRRALVRLAAVAVLAVEHLDDELKGDAP